MLLTLLLAIGFAPLNVLASDEGLFRPLTYDAALAAAKDEKRVVMIDFFTTWCAPCKKLDATTWKDPAVLAWARETCVAIKLDAEQNVELAKRHKIESYPTMIFLRAEGTEIERVSGYKDAPTFLAEAKDALAGKSAITRAKEALAGRENDPMAREHFADALMRRGKYEEALAEYSWCFDHGLEHRPSYAGVRGSFLLSKFGDLARKYPPARVALETRRDAAETRALAHREDGDALDDCVAICTRLGEHARIVQLFDRMSAAAPLTDDQRRCFGKDLRDAFMHERRFADALAWIGDVDAFVDEELAPRESRDPFGGMGKELGLSDEERENLRVNFDAMAKRDHVEECVRVYEALLATRAGERARAVADRILAFEPKADTYTQLVAAGVRTGERDAARALADRAVATASEKDKKRIERAMKRELAREPVATK